jgi:NIPSNAP
VAIFQKHGAEIVGVWQHIGNPDTLVWMLAYPDRAHRDYVWAKFNADPEWTAFRAKYPVPVNANPFVMSASDYSPMK